MPYLQKIKDNLVDVVSDFGWEIASVEYELDMLPDDEECPLVEQEQSEITCAYIVDEYSWNKQLKGKNGR